MLIFFFQFFLLIMVSRMNAVSNQYDTYWIILERRQQATIILKGINLCNTLATWCEELTHLRRPWCWERLKAGGEGDYRGWDGWMASPIQWTWVWVNSGGWWWTGRPGVLWFMGLKRVRHDWATELNWILLCLYVPHLLDPFICRWTFRLLLCLSYCK